MENMEDRYTIKEIQAELASILKQVAEFCDKHGLRYYVFGGTCLGAVRHHGFIPWDDDVDIAMPRDDYEKFKQFAGELPKGLAILDGYMSAHYSCCMMRVHDVNTTFILKNYENYPDRYCGWCVDIMPLDGAPQNKNEQAELHKKLAHLRHRNIKHRMKYKAKGLRAVIIEPISAILRLLLPPDYYFKKFDKLVRSHKFDESDTIFHGAAALFPIHKVAIPRICFEESIDMPFEDFTVKVPKEYDMYLRYYYGDDYMTPKPEQDRILHDFVVNDLEKPYAYYAERKKKGLPLV